VIKDGEFIGGKYVAKFELEFAEYLKVKHVIGVGNGYDALVISLKALGVKEGDCVAVPAHTFIATWLAVQAVGATPVGVDCDNNGLIDLNELEINKQNFKAVIPVHMHGRVVDMKRLIDWAAVKNVKIIEDCAQSHGADYMSIKSGAWGDIAAFSFYPTKNLGALGDAGAISTNSDELAEKVRMIANYGSNKKYKYTYLGVNSRLDPVQASILSVNLRKLDLWNNKRQKIAKKYLENMGSLENMSVKSKESVWHHFTIQVKNREQVIKLFNEHNIGTEIHYPELASDIYSKLMGNMLGEFPKARDFVSQVLSIPIYPWLSKKSIKRIIRLINHDIVKQNLIGDSAINGNRI
jgi:dTDP-4-amino-4,6-dideoxygalactose transaminase